MPHWACMSENEASLQIAPMSPKWLASRSSSAISARSQTARGGTSIAERGLDGAGEGERIGDRAVAGGAAGEPRGLVEVGARHQRLDALVHIAEALLQPHHRLAIGGEAEMAGLDDAGMHRADRDLVQALAFGRQEGIGRARRRASRRAASGCARPRSRDRARAAGRAGPPARCRTGRGSRAPAGSPADAARRPTESARSGHSRVTTAISRARSSSSAMCTAPASPHRPSSVQWPAASWLGEAPAVVVDHDARPRTMAVVHGRLRSCRSARSSILSQQLRDVLEPGDQRRRHVDAGDQDQREMREHRHVGGLRLRGGAARLAERDGVEPQEQRGDADQDAEDQQAAPATARARRSRSPPGTRS